MTGAGSSHACVVLSPEEGEIVWFDGLGVRFTIGGKETGETLALVKHPIEPRVLAAPLHTHRHEDEYSYALEGKIRVQVGDEVYIARPSDLVF